jgi:glutamine synthetase
MSSNSILLEYIWIDGSLNLRSKTKVHYNDISNLTDLPIWNYDGSSTGQFNDNGDTEIILKPVKFIKDPFRRYITSFLVLCDTYDSNDNPALNNNRLYANNLFNQKLDLEPWFGLEQEYFLIDELMKLWPVLYNQGEWYCGIGKKQPIERLIVEQHLECCLYSGLNISGINSEVAPYQWEFQIGPCIGIDAGDQLWLARYILSRIVEKFGITVSYKPKILKEINGSGCHTNFSTIETRSNNPLISYKPFVDNQENSTGIGKIFDYINKLAQVHPEHIDIYGTDNHERLTGLHETGSINIFSFGIGTRNTSIRIPNQVNKDGYGYFEDRRPAANIDPYLVTSKIFKTCCL